MATGHACIFVTGGDMSLREAGWHLIDRGIATTVNLVEAGDLYVTEDGDRKISASGRALLILVDAARVDEAFEAIREIHGLSDLSGYALPVLATL